MKYVVAFIIVVVSLGAAYFSFIKDSEKGYSLLIEAQFKEDILLAQQILPIVCKNDDILLHMLNISGISSVGNYEKEYDRLVSIQDETIDLIKGMKVFNEEQRDVLNDMRVLLKDSDIDSLNQLQEVVNYLDENVDEGDVLDYIRYKIRDFTKSDKPTTGTKIELYIGQEIDEIYEDDFNLLFDIVVSKIVEGNKEYQLCLYQFKDIIYEILKSERVFSKKEK